MANTHTADDIVISDKGAVEYSDSKHDNDMSKAIPIADVREEENTEYATDIDHVARLGLYNAAELEKKIFRALDTSGLSQLWITYMFNYLNRANIAQARLNSFDLDLNLGESDCQV
jgi:hypothetical protein